MEEKNVLLGKRLQTVRKEAGLSLQEVSEQLKREYGFSLTKGMLSKYENGVHEPGVPVIAHLCRIYRVSCDDFIRGCYFEDKDLQDRWESKCIRLNVCEKPPIPGEEEILTGEYVDIPMTWTIRGNHLAFFIQDDSMSPLLEKGDVAIVCETGGLETGGIFFCYCRKTGLPLLRRLEERENLTYLLPENIYYPVVSYTEKEVSDEILQIIGRLVEVRRTF